MTTKVRRKSKQDVAETERASYIEEAIMYLECSDRPVVHTGWYASGEAVGQVAIAARVLQENPLDEPDNADSVPDTGLWCNGDSKEISCEVITASRLSFTEKSRLSAIGAIPSVSQTIFRDRRFKIDRQGHIAKSERLFSFGSRKGDCSRWVPVHGYGTPIFYQEKIKYTGNSYKTYTVEGKAHFDTIGLALMQYLGWASRRLWHVKISATGCDRGILFATSAAGVRGFFALRDKAAGETRRSALIHWVKTNAIKAVSEESEETEARWAVRGKDTFSWFGFDCEITTPDLTPEEREAVRERAKKRGVQYVC